jgi:transposase
MDGIRLDYQQLRAISPKAARQAILQVLEANKGNVSKTADTLGVTRRTIYKALKKKEQGNLNDLSHTANHVVNKTSVDIEKKVIELKNRTNYGPLRIKDELKEVYGITLSHHTIRNIVRRNKSSIKRKKNRLHKRSSRTFVDWYSAKPFEVVQIDLKYIIDQKALTQEQINHVFIHDLPIYQWGALDVNSRFKLIAYSKEKSWTNGLTWFLWVTSWLRSHGVTGIIIYTVDHGMEFGGDCWYKIVELRKLLSGFGCRLIQNHKKSPQENAQLERSHRTDDEEFYIPRILSIKTKGEFYQETLQYIYYYNCVRKHSGIEGKTPYQKLTEQLPSLDARIKVVPPIFLDKISVDLGPWSGYHRLAQYLINHRG